MSEPEGDIMVPSKSRPEIVARIRAKGLTQQEIAATAGVGVGTVNADLKFNSENDGDSITNSRGQQRPATYTRTESMRVAIYRKHLMRRGLSVKTVELRVYWLRRLEAACGNLGELTRDRLETFLEGDFTEATKRSITATANDYWKAARA